MSDEDRILLQTVARVVLSDDAGSLADQANRRCRSELMLPAHRPTKKQTYPIRPSAPAAKQDLAYFNGLGGFSQDGREYVITQMAGQSTPAPWVNVIANESIGTVISESGSCYTWVGNSHEFRITPWNNDPVSDTCGEAIYIRDEETGRIWSAAPAPARGTSTYVTRHGFGYSIFDCSDDGIVTELCVYVAIDSPIKFSKLKISNQSGRPRQLSVTSYSELVLGESRSKSQMHIGTEVDPVTNAVFARNPYSSEFSEQVAFFDCSESVRTITCDRCEFIGRNGDMTHPAALLRTRLSGKVGSGLDPCVAMQTVFELDVGQERTVVFTMGAAENATKARQLVQRHRGLTSAHRAIEGVWHYWSQTLGAVHLETPDASLNYLANGWLLYQTLACRMWARTGFYQSGGAYGFRDQLQDAMALVHSQPSILREQLLRAAGRQFREGDVQHWWHPPVGRGVRTHFSDDFLWLPLAVCRYVSTTGDTGLLDERVPFLTTRLLHDDEEANYDLPQVSADIGSLYEHAQRALDHELRFGEHGLPLMGCGDWNDGMNLVGQHGKGESVWLGFFLYDVLNQFADLASQRGDAATTERYHLEANRIRGNIEESAWDGQWYRRAYFDDGTPLGSAENEECQIDSISQSWSILSGAGTSDRAITAMNSLDRRLVRRDDRLIQLLDPPFDHSALNPGYIKGYVPGVRENGGQYTHAAIWTIMAFAAMKDNDRAWELFRMINPISHGATPDSIAKYRVEPYVVAADVYAVAPHIGRGGWTWYTGSAGWMYRLISESLLGLELNVDRLLFHPRPPRDWTSYKIHYRYRETFYHITFLNCQRGSNIERISMDGVELPNPWVTLTDDRGHHTVDIELG
jgi:cellobiose phosphorylase